MGGFTVNSFPKRGETEVLAKDFQLERRRIQSRFADTNPMFPVSLP